MVFAVDCKKLQFILFFFCLLCAVHRLAPFHHQGSTLLYTTKKSFNVHLKPPSSCSVLVKTVAAGETYLPTACRAHIISSNRNYKTFLLQGLWLRTVSDVVVFIGFSFQNDCSRIFARFQLKVCTTIFTFNVMWKILCLENLSFIVFRGGSCQVFQDEQEPCNDNFSDVKASFSR